MPNEQEVGLTIYSGLNVVADVTIFIIKFLLELIITFVKLFLPANLKELNNERVLITGTGHGIGKELAKQYSEYGCEVICIDINDELNKETVQEINSQKAGTAYAYKCDVTNRDQVIQLSSIIKSNHGNVSVIVNNAGIMPCHEFYKHTPEEIKKTFDVNVFSHFWILEAFLPQLIEAGRGHIVALSSIAGIVGLPNLAPYCASKYAVRGLMEALREELRLNMSLNIHFTTIFPYMVDTGLCKKPKIKFPSLLGLIKPKDAAASIIKAHRANMKEATIPRILYYINNIVRLLPEKCSAVVLDFCDSGVEAE